MDSWSATVLRVLAETTVGGEPGPSGLRVEHVRAAVRDSPAGSHRVVAGIAAVTDAICAGLVPAALRDVRLMGIPKGSSAADGYRPLGAGEFWRQLAARIAIAQIRPALEAYCVPCGQLGLSTMGTQRVVTRVRLLRQATLLCRWMFGMPLTPSRVN